MGNLGAIARRATSIVYLNGGPDDRLGGEPLVGGETVFPALPRRLPDEQGGARPRGPRQRKYGKYFQKVVNQVMDRTPPTGSGSWPKDWPELQFNDVKSTGYQ